MVEYKLRFNNIIKSEIQIREFTRPILHVFAEGKRIRSTYATSLASLKRGTQMRFLNFIIITVEPYPENRVRKILSVLTLFYQLFFYEGVFNARGNWDYCRIVLYFNSFILNLHKAMRVVISIN